ncbi:MAG: hypothetical protein IJY87_00445, partial [Bacilli bacterium]|nr:hypothetical protein [Bacilli bacterium]
MNLLSILSFIITIPYLILVSKNNLHMLQQNFYNENNRYLKWGKNNLNKIIIKEEIIILVVNLLNIVLQNDYLLLINLGYIYLYIKVKKEKDNEQVKIPLKITSRLKRLVITISIIYLVPFILYILLNNSIYLTIYLILVFINFLIVYLSNIINIPIENIVFNYYKMKAIKKLKSINYLEVVGVTGSYGKTSSKNILNDILRVKYNVFSTPKNYNTQY